MSRARVKGLAVAGATVVLGVGLGFAFLEGRNRDDRTWRYWERRLPQELEAARAAGIWTSAEEIDEPVQSDKAGRELAAIWGEIEAAGLEGYQYAGWYTRFGQGDKSRDEALSEIEQLRQYFPRIYELLEKGDFAWPPTTPGAVDRMVEGARVNTLIMNAARVEARKGNLQEIERAFRAHLRIGDFMMRSGHIRGIGLGLGTRRRMAEALMSLAVDPSVPPEEVERLAEMITVPEIEWRHALRHSGMLPGEVDLPSSKDKPKWKATDAGELAKAVEWEAFWSAPISGVERAARARQLHYFNEIWPLLDRPEREIVDANENPPKWTKKPEHPWPLERLRVYWIPNYVAQNTDERGFLATRVAGARLLAAQRRTGRLPAKLGLEMPLDPWTGKSLPYEVAGSEFYLWSAGRYGTTTRLTAGHRLFDSAQTRRNQLAMMAPRP